MDKRFRDNAPNAPEEARKFIKNYELLCLIDSLGEGQISIEETNLDQCHHPEAVIAAFHDAGMTSISLALPQEALRIVDLWLDTDGINTDDAALVYDDSMQVQTKINSILNHVIEFQTISFDEDRAVLFPVLYAHHVVRDLFEEVKFYVMFATEQQKTDFRNLILDPLKQVRQKYRGEEGALERDQLGPEI